RSLIYTLSLHDALPIWISRLLAIPAGEGRIALLADRGLVLHIVDSIARPVAELPGAQHASGLPHIRRPRASAARRNYGRPPAQLDRKSTRLNSSHVSIS